ncbi:hypothetical protein WN48_08450 [Eufriesea mexicana]|uniref:Uncharacterized protein n=1 Tax=Eufriesea mexicana TaxID=516756 RepID=A0A310SI65_9HYME|nr:hypothetical protein WN48_08450 [Eufriesea mexicana]
MGTFLAGSIDPGPPRGSRNSRFIREKETVRRESAPMTKPGKRNGKSTENSSLTLAPAGLQLAGGLPHLPCGRMPAGLTLRRFQVIKLGVVVGVVEQTLNNRQGESRGLKVLFIDPWIALIRPKLYRLSSTCFCQQTHVHVEQGKLCQTEVTLRNLITQQELRRYEIINEHIE